MSRAASWALPVTEPCRSMGPMSLVTIRGLSSPWRNRCEPVDVMLLMAAIGDVHSVPAAAVRMKKNWRPSQKKNYSASLLEPMDELETTCCSNSSRDFCFWRKSRTELAATELELFTELELATVLDDIETVVAARFGMLPEARKTVKYAWRH